MFKYSYDDFNFLGRAFSNPAQSYDHYWTIDGLISSLTTNPRGDFSAPGVTVVATPMSLMYGAAPPYSASADPRSTSFIGPSAGNILDGMAQAGSMTLTALAANAGQMSATITFVESQAVSHVVNAPSVVNSAFSFGQFFNAFANGDPKAMASSGASIFTGALVAEIGTYLAVTTLGMTALPATLAVAALVTGAAVVMDHLVQRNFDAAWGGLSDNAKDAILQNLRMDPAARPVFYGNASGDSR